MTRTRSSNHSEPDGTPASDIGSSNATQIAAPHSSWSGLLKTYQQAATEAARYEAVLLVILKQYERRLHRYIECATRWLRDPNDRLAIFDDVLIGATDWVIKGLEEGRQTFTASTLDALVMHKARQVIITWGRAERSRCTLVHVADGKLLDDTLVAKEEKYNDTWDKLTSDLDNIKEALGLTEHEYLLLRARFDLEEQLVAQGKTKKGFQKLLAAELTKRNRERGPECDDIRVDQVKEWLRSARKKINAYEAQITSALSGNDGDIHEKQDQPKRRRTGASRPDRRRDTRGGGDR
jgi:hypothetical protein